MVKSLRKKSPRGGGKCAITNLVVFVFLCLLVLFYAVGLIFIFGSSGSGGDPNPTRDSIIINHEHNPMNVRPKPRVDNSVGSGNVKKGNDSPPRASAGTATIGWAVTITGCGSDPITEGAAVLKHAIHLTSIHGNLGGKYDYKMYAIYHPDGFSCAEPLKDLGYTLVKRETPVAVKDIKGTFLREHIENNGCCGEKELVKLEAYTLTDHPVVVHLDLDVIVLKPFDALFDWMLSNDPTNFDTSDVPIMWPELEKPQKVNAYITRDYNMVPPKSKYKPVQGGFLVLRPDMKVYNEFKEIIKEGVEKEGQGWGGLVGPFYGWMTFQGLIPYYYDVLHPNEAVELNRCIYNQMADNPKDKRTVNDIPQGRCRTDQEECEDCRNRPIEEVVTAHFTLCQKPWHCLPQDADIIQQRLCHKLHHAWYSVRSDLEKSWGRSGNGNSEWFKDHFYGYCTKHGNNGYMPIAKPYGAKAVEEVEAA